MKLNRRQILEAFLFATAGVSIRPRRAYASAPKQAKSLIVFTLTGGASFVNAFLARKHSEVSNPETLDVFDDDEIIEFGDSPLRAVRLSNRTLSSDKFLEQNLALDLDAQVRFLTNHRDQLTIATVNSGSITHPIAQHRAMTGGGAWHGRTITEAFVAAGSAIDVPIPNITMASAGFLQPGSDASLTERARQEPISAPSEWFLGLHGSRGIVGAPDADLIELARRARDEGLERSSDFVLKNIDSSALTRWALKRGRAQRELEALDLITRLCFSQDPAMLSQFGLNESPDAASVREVFPRWSYDPLEAQAALAFLLLRYEVTAAVTIGSGYEMVFEPSGAILNPSVSFDSSHTRSRPVQALMWGRVLSVADRLMQMMKQTIIDDSTGETLWDGCVIYFVGEFGRETARPSNELIFGTSHHPRGAIMLASSMLPGGRILGGVDGETLQTYGFDVVSGTPMQDQVVREDQIFAGVLTALGIDLSLSTLPSLPVFGAQRG